MSKINTKSLLYRFRKTLLLIGGSGELGQQITRRFAKPTFRKWWVVNIDKVPNPDATVNIIVDLEKQNPFEFSKVEEIAKQLRDHNEEYDAIVNLATTPEYPKASISDGFELFEEYERVQQANLFTSLLQVHIAANHLAPNGYLGFNGSHDVFTEGQDLPEIQRQKLMAKLSLLERIQRQVVMKQGLDLAVERLEEGLISPSAKMNVLLFEDMITQKDRKSKVEMKKHNNRLMGIANMLKYWASGDNTPENGAFVQFDHSRDKKGKVTLPKFY